MRSGFRCLLLAFFVSVPTIVQAGVIYRWIDDQGRAHISDQPPPHGARQAEQLRSPSFARPDLRPDEDPYSILNQLKRLEDARRQLARERMEQRERDREYALRQRELEAREDLAASSGDSGVHGYLLPYLPRPPVHRPGRPGHGPGPPTLWPPEHPAYRPHPPRPRPMPYPSAGGGRIGPVR